MYVCNPPNSSSQDWLVASSNAESRLSSPPPPPATMQCVCYVLCSRETRRVLRSVLWGVVPPSFPAAHTRGDPVISAAVCTVYAWDGWTNRVTVAVWNLSTETLFLLCSRDGRIASYGHQERSWSRLPNINKKFSHFPWHDKEHIRTDASNNSSIIASVFVAVVTLLQSRSLAIIGDFT